MNTMRLEGQNFVAIDAPTQAQVRQRVRALWSAGKHSYASLASADGSHVQVAGGKATCMVERFDAGTAKRWRAFHGKPSPVFPDGTQLVFGAGEVALKADEWFAADAVLEIFLSFMNEEPYPDTVRWRAAPGF
ncbi:MULTISPECIES: hypothetical protein [unclassified Variovorax]|jgi:hypothetical protein|uniref:hypothetical protein n=1 Tax=unclassified Variovorax TaxID=663243 RepID=UPI0008CE0193|nr:MULTISPECIES: hypothetical protein [unclassified Variovorax]SEK15165.1 hypothetical protein SAMN05518853_116144 [Variovorax sp. OK202]SFE09753.1 hypothetical protein SAMN05444746_116144 [Variovorax sp. OK212]